MPFEQCAHIVCDGCGAPGIARIAAAKHPRDVKVTCPECGFKTSVAFAGIGAMRRAPETPDMPIVDWEPRWRLERRRAIGIGGRGSSTNDWYGAER